MNKYDEMAEYNYDTLVRLVISYQGQMLSNQRDNKKLKEQSKKLLKKLEKLNEKCQKVLEQVVLSNRKRFMRSSGKT